MIHVADLVDDVITDTRYPALLHNNAELVSSFSVSDDESDHGFRPQSTASKEDKCTPVGGTTPPLWISHIEPTRPSPDALSVVSNFSETSGELSCVAGEVEIENLVDRVSQRIVTMSDRIEGERRVFVDPNPEPMRPWTTEVNAVLLRDDSDSRHSNLPPSEVVESSQQKSVSHGSVEPPQDMAVYPAIAPRGNLVPKSTAASALKLVVNDRSIDLNIAKRSSRGRLATHRTVEVEFIPDMRPTVSKMDTGIQTSCEVAVQTEFVSGGPEPKLIGSEGYDKSVGMDTLFSLSVSDATSPGEVKLSELLEKLDPVRRDQLIREMIQESLSSCTVANIEPVGQRGHDNDVILPKIQDQVVMVDTMSEELNKLNVGRPAKIFEVESGDENETDRDITELKSD